MSVIKDMTYPYIETKMKKEPAISLDEIKSYLKLHQSNVVVDNELSLMYETALSYAEKYSRRLFTPTEVKTNRLFWGELRNGDFKNIFTLRRSPLLAVDNITYDDDKILPECSYKVINNEQGYGKIILTGDMPEIENEWLPIEINFTAGYLTMPYDIKLAILQHIASMWMNRGDCDNDTYDKCPRSAKNIYKKYKIMEVGA